MAKKAEAIVTIKMKAKGIEALDKATASINKTTKATKKQAQAFNFANKASKKAVTANDKLKNTMRGLASSIAVIDGPLGGVASRFNAFGTTISRVNKKLIGITAAFLALSAVSRIGIKVFGEVEKLTFRLNAALESTGRKGALSLKQLTDAAEKLGRETLTSNEAALEALATLTSFQDIPDSKLIEILNLSQDLSVVLGGDLKQNAILLGRAFNDVESASEFLRRKGLKLNEQEQEQISTLINLGKNTEAITLLQEKLSNIHGLAAAEAKGLAGVYDTLGESIRLTASNFSKYSGGVAAAKVAGRALTGILDTINNNLKAISITIQILAITSIPLLIKAVNTLSASLLVVPFNVAAGNAGAFTIAVVRLKSGLQKAVIAVKVFSKALLANPIFRLAAIIFGTVKAFEALAAIQISTSEGSISLGEVAVFAAKKWGKALLDGPLKVFKDLGVALSTLVQVASESADGFIDVFAIMGVAVSNVFQNLLIDIVSFFKELVPAIKIALDSLPILKFDTVKALASLETIQADAALAKKNIEEKSALITLGIIKDKPIQDFVDKLKLTPVIQAFIKLAEEAAKAKNSVKDLGDEVGKIGLSDKQKKILESLKNQNVTLQEQLRAINLLIVGEEKYASVAALRVKILKDTPTVIKEAIEANIILTRKLEKQNEVLNEQQQLWNGVDSAVKETFASIIRGSDTALGALGKLADKLANIAIESAFSSFTVKAVVGAVLGGATGAPTVASAKGNVFKGQEHITKFGKGGLTSGPTFFPTKSGIGVAGEEDIEAILPLTRLPGGDLGVKSVGRAGGGIRELNMPISVSVTIEGKGQGQGTGASDPEQSRKFATLIGESVRAEVFKVIDKESRAGGRFSPHMSNGGLI